jgi:hypothetical protein
MRGSALRILGKGAMSCRLGKPAEGRYHQPSIIPPQLAALL